MQVVQVTTRKSNPVTKFTDDETEVSRVQIPRSSAELELKKKNWIWRQFRIVILAPNSRRREGENQTSDCFNKF